MDKNGCAKIKFPCLYNHFRLLKIPPLDHFYPDSMKIRLFIIAFLISVTAFAQKTTVSVILNAGASSFRGANAITTTQVGTGGYFCGCLLREPESFGTKGALSYGTGLSLQHATKKRFVLGLDAAYEILRTKTLVDTYTIDDILMNVEGRNVSYNHFINLFPHAGYQFKLGEKMALQVVGGADFGIGLDSYDKLTINNYIKKEYRNTDNITNLDFRPRLQAELSRGRVSVVTSYSYGLVNWLDDVDGADPHVYMNVFRIGLKYRIN
jgi:hypothetical protein